MIPYYASAQTQSFSSSANGMRCIRFRAQTTITNASRLSIMITTGSNSTTCGAGIYSDSDSTNTNLCRISVSCPGTGSSGIAAAPCSEGTFTMTAGTMYRLCVCSSSTAPAFLALFDSTAGSANALWNKVTPSAGNATSTCSSGSPPTDTGALTGLTTRRNPVAYVGQ